MSDVHGPISIEVYRSRSIRRNQRFRWRVWAANGEKLASSGEGYANEPEAREMADYLIREAHPNAEIK